MWTQLSTYEQIGLLVILMGSIVDIFQFTWIIKKLISKARSNLYERAKKEVLLQQLQDKPTHEEEFPGIKSDEGL